MSLEEYRAPTEVRLAALWASTMFCYIYGDYFGLFVGGAIKQIGEGIMGPLPYRPRAARLGGRS